MVYLRPSAAGSGMPELIGFLNGTFIRHIFNVKTLAVKFVSCAFSVASGMPVGPEGPMIHMGALIGAGVSQFQSKTLGFTVPLFQRFRNSQGRKEEECRATTIYSLFIFKVQFLLGSISNSFLYRQINSYYLDNQSPTEATGTCRCTQSR